jgi:hypothetical protein
MKKDPRGIGRRGAGPNVAIGRGSLVIAETVGVFGKETRRAAVVTERHDAPTRAQRGKQ